MKVTDVLTHPGNRCPDTCHIIFSLGAIVGFLFRTLIDHYLAKARTDEDRRAKVFNAAAETFRNSFAPIQQHLASHNLWALITKQFPLHDAARINFIHHLNSKELRRFNKVWQKYKQTYKDIRSISQDELLANNSKDIVILKQSVSNIVSELMIIAKSK